jgi:hypothetical protein
VHSLASGRWWMHSRLVQSAPVQGLPSARGEALACERQRAEISVVAGAGPNPQMKLFAWSFPQMIARKPSPRQAQ